MKRVLVIGGGAAGLMSAISASEAGASVTVLEAGEQAGKKILATGNGKCNFTNRNMAEECFRSKNPEKARQILYRFGAEETIVFFRELGIAVRDRNGYLYPRSEQAASVRAALISRAEELGVRFLYNQKVKELCLEKKGIQAVTANGRHLTDAAILATGGKAAPKTGSDGSGLMMAEALGHLVIPPVPALVQLTASGFPFSKVSGVRAQARVTIKTGRKVLAGDTGEVQLTDYGLSGIPVFQVSRFAAEALADRRDVEAALDFFPEMTKEELGLEYRLRRERHPGWNSASFLNGLLPDKLSAALLSGAGISKKDTWKEIPDKKLQKLANESKELTVKITGTKGFDAAQVTAGGVALDEIDERTCGSRILPGLYFAGEILDVDGICGGYNLQWAWTTGYLAGRAAAGEMEIHQ